MSKAIPVYNNLDKVYDSEDVAEAEKRYKALINGFQDRYHAKPELVARSPGRVNLIGEHIDYSGYSVLPMAIKQDTIVAIRKAGDKIVVGHLEPDHYPTQTFSTDPSQKVDTGKHTWANYFMCAYKGVFEHLSKKGKTAPEVTGLEILVEGRVPTGSGLSSSAALVCAASLALLHVLGISASLQEVAEFTASCEKYVGTESGGMDQAISLMGEQGIAKLIKFNPVQASDVPLPESATFVVANSLTVSNKAETGEGRYNLRVVECRLAAILLALALGSSQEDARKVFTLKQIEPALKKKYGSDVAVEESGLKASKELLHTSAYTQEEVEKAIGVKLEDLVAGNASQLKSVAFASKNGGFKLQQRALHVFSEALRVPQFQEACRQESNDEAKLKKLGQLMDESQESCRDLYDCSCAELDEVISQCKKVGALGSRLTGAGWGGCTVTLVHRDQSEGLIKHLKDVYFSKCVADGKVKENELDAVVFDSRPSSGGAVLKLSL